jgi:para-nitrobenzyl esterase
MSAAGDLLRHPTAGPIHGRIDGSGALSWRGIPYARAPVGDLRWKAPRTLPPLERPLAAVEFADMCPQLGQPMLDIDPALYGRTLGSEDCLYLNIWAPPGTAAGQGLPVMVWVHGGSNVGGAASLHHGGNLAISQEVIVVSLNYRLGLFGWFSHPALRAAAETRLDRSPNFGTLDIIQALSWVKANIAAFGGDAGRITLFGQSAGAMNILSLLYSPPARGLFHRAIVQSGSLRQTPLEVAERLTGDDRSEFSSTETAAKILLNRGEAASRNQARKQVAALGHAQFLALVRGASAEELVATYTPDIGARIRVPQVIPDDIVVPAGSPWELIADPAHVRSVPVMLGSNRDEMKFFLGLDRRYVTIVPGKEIRIHDPQRYELHARYLSDRWTALGVDEPALRLARHNPEVYAYRFDWDDQPSYPQADFKAYFGAAHAMELPFVFNDFERMKMFALHFTGQNRRGREALAAAVGEYWGHFAHTGKPGRGRSGRLPEWPAWGDGNKLLLDAAHDGGIAPHTGALTMQALYERFMQDDAFASEQKKGKFYRALFCGREAWASYFLERLESSHAGPFPGAGPVTA